MGLPEEDFNSYATHRGDHLTAQRATFANPKLFNEMVVVDGEVKQGSLARSSPKARSCACGRRSKPTCAQAAADHHRRRRLRPGLSRDWAAKGVRLAGVEAIVAEGFERIHRTNLIGMGVLPLEFRRRDRNTLGIDGTETFDVSGSARPARC
jgi:aconitate hydratase